MAIPPNTPQSPTVQSKFKKRPFLNLANASNLKPDTRPGASFWDDKDVPLSPRTPRTPKTPRTPTAPSASSPATPTCRTTMFNLTPPSSAAKFTLPSSASVKTPTRFIFPTTPTSAGFSVPSSNNWGRVALPATAPATLRNPRNSWIRKDESVFIWKPEVPVSPTVPSPATSCYYPTVGTIPPSSLPRTTTYVTDVGSTEAPSVLSSRLSLRAGKTLGMNIWRTSRNKCKSLLQGKGSKDRESALEQTRTRGRPSMLGNDTTAVGRRSSSEGPLEITDWDESRHFSSLQSPKLPEFAPLQPLMLGLSEASLSSPEREHSPASSFISESASSSFLPSLSSSSSSVSSVPRSSSDVLSSNSSSTDPPDFAPAVAFPVPSSSLTPPFKSAPLSPLSFTSSIAKSPPRTTSLSATPLVEASIASSRPPSCASKHSSVATTFSFRSSISSISGYSATIASASLIQLFPTPPPEVLSFTPSCCKSPVSPTSTLRTKRKPASQLRVVASTKRNSVAASPAPSAPPAWPLPPVPSPVKPFVLAPAPKGRKALARAKPVVPSPPTTVKYECDDEDSDVDPMLYERYEWLPAGEKERQKQEKQKERAKERERKMGTLVSA